MVGLTDLGTPPTSKKRTPPFKKPPTRKDMKASKPQFDATLTDYNINLVILTVEEVSVEAVQKFEERKEALDE